MLEIYCEKVRDLLDPNPAPAGGLKVREHPKKGFYGEFTGLFNFKTSTTYENAVFSWGTHFGTGREL